MFRAIQFVLIAVVLFGTCAVAQAESIPLLKNVTTGVVIFQDGFESGTVGSPPGQYDPTAGQWVEYSSGASGGYARVTNQATSGVAAYEGSQYLDVYRGGGGSPLLRGDGTASGENDTVMCQVAFYSSRRHYGRLFLTDADTHIAYFLIEPSGVFSVGGSASGMQDLTQTWTAGQWNTLVITHTNHTTDWTISINGQTPETKSSFAAGATGVVSGIKFGVGINNGGIYWDALPIPEPSSLALLATGLIGLLCYAWRKRK